MNISRTTAALAGICLALSLSGCTSSADTEEANTAYCEGASKVETEVDKMAALIKDGSSAELVKAQWGAVQAAIEANSVPLSQLEDAAQKDVAAAYDSFTAAVEAIPADAPPSEAAPQYEAAISGFTTDMDAVKAEVGCT